MFNDPVIIRLKGGAAAYNLDLGFVPSLVQVTVMSATNPDTYRWFGQEMQESAEAIASSWEYGIKNTAGGAETYMATAATGISVYDGSKTPRVRIPAADGDGMALTDVYGDWSSTVDYSSVGTARSTTAVGTVVRPPTHNGKVFELTTATGTGTSEPSSWDVEPGVSVTDGGSNVFICRLEDIASSKGKGITLGATLLENDKIVWIVAWRPGHFRDIGDIG